MDENMICLDSGEDVELREKVGEGSFGQVFAGFVPTRKTQVAVKLEPKDRVRKCLGHEVSVLSDLQPLPCVPRLLGQGTTSTHSYMVMELLGESLNEKFKKCGRIFSVYTVAKLAEKMITALQCVHAMKYIHRDVKPHNFSLTLSSPSDVVLIDFGLSKKISLVSESRCSHGICGTLPFVSLSQHYGCGVSRKDDLEALGFVFVYFLRGKLPWFSPRGEKLSEPAVRRLKEETGIDTLCEGLPREFAAYMRYVRGLRVDQEPDYTGLKVSFTILERRWESLTSGKLDWEVPSQRAPLKRSGSNKSRRSTGASGHCTEESDEILGIDDCAPSRPPLFPLFDNSFCKPHKTDCDVHSRLTLSIDSNKVKRAKKFIGLALMKEVVCASRRKLENTQSDLSVPYTVAENL